MMIIILSCLAAYWVIAMIPGYVMLRKAQTSTDVPVDLLKMLLLSGLFVPIMAIIIGLEVLSVVLFPPKKG